MNGKSAEEYIPFANLREVMAQPFVATETKDQYDVLVNVNGGGFSGQAGATRHGIARALLEVVSRLPRCLETCRSLDS